jgi:hypothetical protein
MMPKTVMQLSFEAKKQLFPRSPNLAERLISAKHVGCLRDENV